jgi:predicted lactoylglutathione lyase
MKEGDFYVKKESITGSSVAADRTFIMLIESKNNEHTGKVKSAITKTRSKSKIIISLNVGKKCIFTKEISNNSRLSL